MKEYTIVIIQGESVGLGRDLESREREIPAYMELHNKITKCKKLKKKENVS